MIRKTRLLAGFMAAVLLSTTCLGGVSAAGEEGITTLNASATEDESTTWNATVTAGETLFPEGTELRFAVADDEKKAAVQEQLMTEIAEEEENTEEDTTAGKTLQDLHVYDFSLTDAQGAAVEYTDKVTYSVKSDSAADTDTDAADYVIYRVVENEDSGEGAAVTLEPIEDSTGTVKLDESGWMTEFSVETEPVERIAVAVYKTAVAETEESSEEEDGTEEEIISPGDVSTLAVDYQQYIKQVETVRRDSYAPMNRLQILNNMDGAKVEVLRSGDGVAVWEEDPTVKQIKVITPEMEAEADGDKVNRAFTNGDFWGSTSEEIGADDGIYNEMKQGVGTNTTAPGGISVMFKGSDSSADNYQWDYRAGWDSTDQNIGTTSMWVELLYTNVGYYNGELINAVARISVTPSKNCNADSEKGYWENADYGSGYTGTYHPMFQASGSLYRGWVWQNVEEFHVELTFYRATDAPRTNPITVGVQNVKDEDYNSMYADYYVVNSLNPQRSTGESPDRFIGPEYVAPTQDIAHAYIVDKYSLNGVEYKSNIVDHYTSNIKNGTMTQYAYNGGTNDWTGNDWIGADGYAENSVMIMPMATSKLEFSMGQLELQPWYNGGDETSGYKQSTHVMWASISTDPFTRPRVPINIDVTKSWDGLTDEEKESLASVTVQLWLQYNTTDGDNSTQTEIQLREITIKPDGNGAWNGTFEMIGDNEFYEAKGYYDPVYVIKEVRVTDTNGKEITGEFTLGGTTTIEGNTITRVEEGKYEINQSFAITNTKSQKGSVTINKKAIDAGGERELPGVEFTLQAALVSGDTWTPDTSQNAYGKVLTTNEDGMVTFTELAEGYYLLTETKTAAGYTLLKDPVRITIPYVITSGNSAGNSPVTGSGVSQSNGDVWYYNLTYTITNGQSFDLPQTGGTSADRIMRTGMVLFVTAGGALLYLNRKRRREQQKS